MKIFLRSLFSRPACATAAIVLAVAVGGCTTKAKARAQAQQAFTAGQNEALKKSAQPQAPVVSVMGQVRNHVIPWEEGLTLAQAIDAAAYTGIKDPMLIRLIRGTESVDIKPKDLLRGAVNPELEAGDIIELRR
jgi:hypothetical protein